ncbi:hypothetical protein AMATHDRAFT_69529 [Amanita thiersii Skay4041]|uniref:SCP domain-containing protein n=1 Tax=Amanita thiersii Skay4041 TaxID=703135 RepID=A0A2A9NE87_9AGAR|nr:hypothetical protein AMATHDRAFT_69529 [Amanita thiersii Skay4041]
MLCLLFLYSLLYFCAFSTAAPADAGDQVVLLDAWSEQVLANHNAARRQYGAKALTWNAGLYPGTLQWAKTCKFQHSNPQGRYGENLYASTGNAGIKNAVDSWMAEASRYDYNHPGFSTATGHFTQVVWKSTTQVACAVANCPAGTIFSQPSRYVVCRYTPPGNYAGQFQQNVGRHI